MKKITIYLFIPLLAINLYSDEIDDIVSKINTKREVKLPKEKLTKIDSPMPKLVIIENNNTLSDGNGTMLKQKNITLKLKGIMNNSANINGKWFKVGQIVEGYKVSDIMDDAVYLKDGNKSKMLFFEQNSSKIKITIGR